MQLCNDFFTATDKFLRSYCSLRVPWSVNAAHVYYCADIITSTSADAWSVQRETREYQPTSFQKLTPSPPWRQIFESLRLGQISIDWINYTQDPKPKPQKQSWAAKYSSRFKKLSTSNFSVVQNCRVTTAAGACNAFHVAICQHPTAQSVAVLAYYCYDDCCTYRWHSLVSADTLIITTIVLPSRIQLEPRCFSFYFYGYCY